MPQDPAGCGWTTTRRRPRIDTQNGSTGAAQRQRGEGSRSYSRRDHAYDNSAVPRHHATAMTRLSPIGEPVSNPRRVSLIGVNGWYSANQRTAVGSESVGTKPLLRNGSSSRNIGELLAVSTL